MGALYSDSSRAQRKETDRKKSQKTKHVQTKNENHHRHDVCAETDRQRPAGAQGADVRIVRQRLAAVPPVGVLFVFRRMESGVGLRLQFLGDDPFGRHFGSIHRVLRLSFGPNRRRFTECHIRKRRGNGGDDHGSAQSKAVRGYSGKKRWNAHHRPNLVDRLSVQQFAVGVGSSLRGARHLSQRGLLQQRRRHGQSSQKSLHRSLSAPLIDPEDGRIIHDGKSVSPERDTEDEHGPHPNFVHDPAAVGFYDDKMAPDDDEEEDLELSLPVAVLMLLISTLLLSFLSDYLVDAIMPMAEQLKISPAFIGIIIIPIVGNAVEQMTAIRMAIKNKMDIALSIAIGSATQVSIFAISSSVLVAWVMDLGLTLAFDSFEQHIFMFSTIIIFAMINDGKTNWFRGVVLLLLYTLIGVGVFHQTYEYHA